MNGHRPSPRSIALILAALTSAMVPSASPGQNPPANQQPPAFKSGVTIVPLDVRVLDKDGRPITDLRQEEFRILENGGNLLGIVFNNRRFHIPESVYKRL